MEYRKLGNTDIDVSVICLGTMTFGEQNNESEGHEQLDFALDHGVNFVDTAELYAVPSSPETQGETERIIGTWIAKTKRRSDIILATKATGPSSFTKHIRTDKDFSRKNLNEALEGSMKRLQTDYIDLYQLHWPARRVNFFGQRGISKADTRWVDNFQELLLALKDLIAEGKIRHFGISNETPWGLNRFLTLSKDHDLPRCMSVQNPYSLLNRLYEVGMSEISMREDVGLLAYSPMAFGLLSGKYHRGPKPKEGRLSLYADRLPRYLGQNSFDATAKYLAIADRYEMSLAQMSLAFVNQQQFLTSNIIGATSIDQLSENIASAEIKLSKEIIAEIDEVHESIPNPAP